MSIFDKFFTKFAYKFDKGYPDMNNDQDVLLLESLINKLLELDFQDTPDLPQEIEDIRSGINSEGTYTVNAIQSKNKSGTKYWVYIDDVAATVRTARLEVTKDLMAKGLLPKGEIKGGTTENFYLEGEDGVTYIIKGTGSKFTTSTNVKEGFVILFYNALKNGWNKSKDPFNDKNMTSLLSDLESLGNGIYTGLGKAEGEIITYLKNFDDGASGSKSAQVSLNDPLSSALRIFKDYPDGDMMRGEYFNTIKTRQEQVTGLPQDKVNPGDIFLKVGEVSLPKTKDIDVTGLEEINKIFVNKWGDKNGLVSISLKQEKAQGGKAKSFLGRYNPDKIDGKEYNLSKEELKYSDDQFDSAIDQLKKSTVEKISSSEFINYNPGKNPSTTARKKFKLAAYKNLDFLFKYLDKLGSSTPADGLVNMTAFGMSITSVNPTFFKVIGKGSGEMAAAPERTPAGATAQLTPGTKITIEDKDSYGGLKIIVYVDVLEGAEVYSQYELELVMRSNGNEQNTIEIQKSTKK